MNTKRWGNEAVQGLRGVVGLLLAMSATASPVLAQTGADCAGTVPEIDATSIVSGATLLVGSLFLAADCLRRRDR